MDALEAIQFGSESFTGSHVFIRILHRIHLFSNIEAHNFRELSFVKVSVVLELFWKDCLSICGKIFRVLLSLSVPENLCVGWSL